ncbi:hypothetical protein VTO42DRAFT_1890 [Malbranchea cinnamomea]
MEVYIYIKIYQGVDSNGLLVVSLSLSLSLSVLCCCLASVVPVPLLSRICGAPEGTATHRAASPVIAIAVLWLAVSAPPTAAYSFFHVKSRSSSPFPSLFSLSLLCSLSLPLSLASLSSSCFRLPNLRPFCRRMLPALDALWTPCFFLLGRLVARWFFFFLLGSLARPAPCATSLHRATPGLVTDTDTDTDTDVQASAVSKTTSTLSWRRLGTEMLRQTRWCEKPDSERTSHIREG